MTVQNELEFLCEVFERNHVRVAVAELQTVLREFSGLIKNELFDDGALFLRLLPKLRQRTVYRLTDSYERCHSFLLLPDAAVPTMLVIGLYLVSPVSPKRLMEIGEQNGISPSRQRYLAEYYASLPVLAGDCQLSVMFHTFCERLWKTPTFATEELSPSTVSEKTTFDRADSGFTEASADDFDFEAMLDGSDWLYLTGITPALSDGLLECTLALCDQASKCGVGVEFDVNYRPALSTPQQAGAVLKNWRPSSPARPIPTAAFRR